MLIPIVSNTDRREKGREDEHATVARSYCLISEFWFIHCIILSFSHFFLFILCFFHSWLLIRMLGIVSLLGLVAVDGA